MQSADLLGKVLDLMGPVSGDVASESANESKRITKEDGALVIIC